MQKPDEQPEKGSEESVQHLDSFKNGVAAESTQWDKDEIMTATTIQAKEKKSGFHHQLYFRLRTGGAISS